MSTHLEQKIDRCIRDLALLEEHVQHIAATLVAIVELAKAPVIEVSNRVDL